MNLEGGCPSRLDEALPFVRRSGRPPSKCTQDVSAPLLIRRAAGASEACVLVPDAGGV